MLRNIKNHLKLLFCKERELYVFYYKFLGFYPYDISYYNEAFTHRSSSVKSKNGTDINNERLEFLGDAILDAIVADILFKQFPNKKEGFLTSTRAKIVQRENLNKIGLSLQLDKIIKTAIHSKSHNSYMYGNAVEALIGAIYLDKGYKVCKTFIIKNVIGDNLNKVANEELNYKSKLIEWSQKSKVSISFELISTTTDEQHNPIFKTAVLLGEVFAADGLGYSKKESHQVAAKQAYIRLEGDMIFREQVLSTVLLESI